VVGVLTVCYGHTGTDIVPSKTYDGVECTVLLEKDIEIAAKGVLAVTPGIHDKPYILASAISFSYNVGVTTYRKSSVARNFNAGNYKAGCEWMLKYTYAKGKYIQGLANRRKHEYDICMKGVTNDTHIPK
jgi:lysozyme